MSVLIRISSISIDLTLSNKEILRQYMQHVNGVLDFVQITTFLEKLHRLILYQHDEVFDVHEIEILHEIIASCELPRQMKSISLRKSCKIRHIVIVR